MVKSMEMEEKEIKEGISEKGPGSFLRFITPTIAVVISALLLGLFSMIFLFVIDVIYLPMGLNNISANLLLLFMSQMAGTVVVYFVLIPFFKVKDAEHESFGGSSVRRTFIFFAMQYGVWTLIAILIVFILNSVGQPPQTGYGSILITEELLNDPFTIAIFFITPTIGAGVFEELIFRRMAIPALEDRGMSPTAASLASALLFALWHVPNDLINGNITGAMIHFLSVFVIGTALGIAYIITRNVIVPMALHALINLMGFLGYFVVMTNNVLFLILFVILQFILIVGGVVSVIYFVVQYFRKPDTEWVRLMKKKSEVKVRSGTAGFVIIGMGLLIVALAIELGLVVLVITGIIDYLTLIITLIACYVVLITVLTWLSRKSKYNPENQNRKL